LSIEFPRQEHGSGLPFPSKGELPNPRIELATPALRANSLPLIHLGNLKFKTAYGYVRVLLVASKKKKKAQVRLMELQHQEGQRIQEMCSDCPQ